MSSGLKDTQAGTCCHYSSGCMHQTSSMSLSVFNTTDCSCKASDQLQSPRAAQSLSYSQNLICPADASLALTFVQLSAVIKQIMHMMCNGTSETRIALCYLPFMRVCPGYWYHAEQRHVMGTVKKSPPIQSQEPLSSRGCCCRGMAAVSDTQGQLSSCC